MKHVGIAIEKFRKINKISTKEICKKVKGLKETDLKSFLAGKSMLDKPQRIAICKAINTAPEVIVMESLEAKDVAKDKQAAFKAVNPTLKKWVTSLTKDLVKEKAQKKKK